MLIRVVLKEKGTRNNFVSYVEIPHKYLKTGLPKEKVEEKLLEAVKE